MDKNLPKNPQFTPKDGGKGQKVSIFLEKLFKSPEFKSLIGMVGEIILFGVFAGMTYFGLTSNIWYMKVLGFGFGLWLCQMKLLPMLVSILNSIRLVEHK
jgi:hypothetical protein